MKLDIYRQAGIFGIKYKILSRNDLLYVISRGLLRRGYRFYSGGNLLQARMVKSGFNIFRLLSNYIVKGNCKASIVFDTDSDYTLLIKNKKVDACQQQGYHVGFFFRGVQIGVLESEKKITKGKTKYKLLLDDEYELIPFLSFVVAYDYQIKGIHSDVTTHIDNGVHGIEPKFLINPRWNPPLSHD